MTTKNLVPYRVLYLESLLDAVHGEAPLSVSLAGYKEVGVVEAPNLGALFADMNAVDGTETCCRMHVRSMSVGDLAIDTRDDAAYYCASVGWKRVELDP